MARNGYSVPCDLARQMVSTRLYPDLVVVVADERVAGTHERLTGKGKTVYDWQHYIPLAQNKPGALRNGAPFLALPEPLARLRVVLLRHAGPSGRVSPEHVANVLGRLTAPPRPENVSTALGTVTRPKADTARYDGLRRLAEQKAGHDRGRRGVQGTAAARHGRHLGRADRSTASSPGCTGSTLAIGCCGRCTSSAGSQGVRASPAASSSSSRSASASMLRKALRAHAGSMHWR